ncbi:hypothetical protein LDZ44_05465 [Bacteroides xylanisolvens]|uniref:hypothetical protein n=1 Tax=Bacteroides xylanisolvens TaxID=371601 RepID=UPI001CDD6A7D|nr:hypothetical protein [Bacteroides xylanisolvens]MCA4478393.1 hypothetical protein [Bacteroides xylanisolvens]MCA4487634.1 hypothetical protein [Bacteroides xylanisolvens]MCA4491894.1 hypothetical protein [Bacteroides xylanisolvens]MCA4496364.1 hypothetical protein [Bacteroides xylanisolvens]MCA4500685.1 hypothetical protein [Bacteroides xylanisolvens]
MKEQKVVCIHFLDGTCEYTRCEEVLDDGTPILTPRCAFPHEVTISEDAPPKPADFADYCPDYKPLKKP